MLGSAAMAEVKPFRAVRYVEAAGPLQSLVAPPYDVISPEERERFRAASSYNVVHLTLADDEAEAGRLWREWRADGVLEDEPEGVWWLSQDYVGPEEVARTREGLVAALRAEPYETRVVLPHERTHRGPKEGRLRLLRETRAQLEPLFFLYEGEPVARRPDPEPDLEVQGSRLWRLPPDGSAEALDVRLVDRLGHEGISYTPDWRQAVGAVDAGDAEVAVLMRPTRIEDVFAVAKRGETMPQKSTYFYPKLVSGLLFLPLG